MISNQRPSYAPIASKEDLRLNSLLFNFPTEPVTFWFSKEDRDDVPLTPLTLQLFPSNIETIFPGIGNADTIYTSFTRKLDGFTPLAIDFGDLKNFALVKRYYNREIKHFFSSREIIVEPTYIKDNQVWLRTKEKQEKMVKDCAYFDRFTIKVNYNYQMRAPELVISYDRPAKVYRKSVADFIKENNDATDPFSTQGENPVDLMNRVLRVVRRKKDNSRVYSVTKYERLCKAQNEGDEVDFSHVYPVVNNRLAAFLGFEEETEEEDNPFLKKNRYTKYIAKITEFKKKYLCTDDFRKLISVADEFTTVSAGQVQDSSKKLVFGKNNYGVNQTDVVPQRGINHGPFRHPDVSNIKLFLIAHEDQKDLAIELYGYIKNGYGTGFSHYIGLHHYLGLPFTLVKGITFSSVDDPIPEISQKLGTMQFDPNDKYIAIYLTPISKHTKNTNQKAIYYRIKELLLYNDIALQCIETDKMSAHLDEDKRKKRSGFTYTLQNMSIAINAKLGGTPWRIAVPEKRELVIGVGAFKNMDTNVQYIGSAFSFDNTGSFNSFEYFHKDELQELAGSIQNAVLNFRNLVEEPSRLIIHYYKDMSEAEVEVIEQALYALDLDIPIYVVTINKTESEDVIVFDNASRDLMPYSGRFVNLGRNTYLLCNNTRYENGKAPEGYPFPVKLKIHSPNADETLDQNTIAGLIDQVYQFSRIYWKSVRQQNLPVTIKYPEMVAQIAPYFTGGDIPENMGRDNLWFL